MKKLLLLFLCLICITGCHDKKDVNKSGEDINKSKDDVVETSNVESDEVVQNYVDDNDISVGLYLFKNSSYGLITDYYDSFTKFTDIGVFSVIYSKDSVVDSGYLKSAFYSYYNNYVNAGKYKIGYNIHFSLKDGQVVDLNIFRPSDVMPIFGHIQIYLYDDVHQDGGFYSHVEDKDYNDNTLLTSIKLTASEYIEDVVSPIKLSAFTYDQDDFDADGKYRGNSIYSINVIKN